jgi:hypothetical protein
MSFVRPVERADGADHMPIAPQAGHAGHFPNSYAPVPNASDLAKSSGQPRVLQRTQCIEVFFPHHDRYPFIGEQFRAGERRARECGEERTAPPPLAKGPRPREEGF